MSPHIVTGPPAAALVRHRAELAALAFEVQRQGAAAVPSGLDGWHSAAHRRYLHRLDGLTALLTTAAQSLEAAVTAVDRLPVDRPGA